MLEAIYASAPGIGQALAKEATPVGHRDALLVPESVAVRPGCGCRYKVVG